MKILIGTPAEIEKAELFRLEYIEACVIANISPLDNDKASFWLGFITNSKNNLASSFTKYFEAEAYLVANDRVITGTRSAVKAKELSIDAHRIIANKTIV